MKFSEGDLVIAPDGFIGYITNERSPTHVQNDPFYDTYVFIRDINNPKRIVMYTKSKHLQLYTIQKETAPELTGESCSKETTNNTINVVNDNSNTLVKATEAPLEEVEPILLLWEKLQKKQKINTGDKNDFK